jgi:MOSC domain-containing protein YiiM
VVEGVTEADVCLGDHWRLGTALLVVSQGRQPCWKLNVRFGRDDMARRVQLTGRSGWYLRVLESGTLAAGQIARLVDRPHLEWPITRVSHLLYHAPLDAGALSAFAGLPGLPDGWRRLAERRLATRRIEDWRQRIDTPRAD